MIAAPLFWHLLSNSAIADSYGTTGMVVQKISRFLSCTNRAPAEIDHLHAGAAIGPSHVTDRRELPVLDRHGRYDRIASIEGVNLSIDQLDIARACAIVSVARESRSDHRHTRQQCRRN